MTTVTSVQIAAATRRGSRSPLSEDAIGIDGWALHADDGAVFPGWGPGGLQFIVAQQAARAVVVADGVGGRVGGQAAGLLAAERLSRSEVVSRKEYLAREIQQVHEQMQALAAQRAELSEMGATVAGAVVLGSGRVCHFNLGDARCYYTNGSTLVQASRDDTIPISFSTRTQLAHWLGRPGSEPMSPWIQVLDAVQERRVLLCSDGLYEAIDSEQLLQEIMCDPGIVSPVDHVSRLMAAAAQAEDDVTVAVLYVSAHSADRIIPTAEPQYAIAGQPTAAPADRGENGKWKTWWSRG